MAPQKQQAIIVKSFKNADGFNNLELQETDVPQLKDGQVLVRIKLRCVNPTDTYQSRGDYGGEPPFVPGSEAVGVVEQRGPGTSSRLSKGQRVVSGNWGTASYQQYAAIDEKYLVAVPDDISDEIAAQIFITTGEWLLQTAAASGLGRQVIQYAKHIGVKTINLVRRQEQVEELKALGADEVVVAPNPDDVPARVKEITGGAGAYAALECVAGTMTSKVLASTRTGGTVIWYGWLAEPVQHIRIQDFFSRTLTNFIIYAWLPSHGPEKARALFDDAFKLFRDGVLSAHPGRRFPLTDFKAALEASVAAGRTAKTPKVFLEG